MERKERPAYNREILPAGGAPVPEQAIPAALIGVQAAAMWADRRAVCLRPANLAEHSLGFRVRHAENAGEAQRLGRIALEVIREIAGFGEGLVGRLVLVDALGMRFDTLRYRWDPANPLNGTAATASYGR
jgi:hypothetical protein